MIKTKNGGLASNRTTALFIVQQKTGGVNSRHNDYSAALLSC
jgi:hypothetical protein